MAPGPLPKNIRRQTIADSMAHYDGTQHHVHSPAMAPPILKVVRRPPPFLEVRTPVAIAFWGKTTKSVEKINRKYRWEHWVFESFVFSLFSIPTFPYVQKVEDNPKKK